MGVSAARSARRSAASSWRVCLVAAIVLLATLPLQAQVSASTPARLADSFRSRVYLRDEGLPDVVARSLAQGPDGFLWVGTFNGLARFDGRRFRVTRTAELPELIEDGFVCLHFDRAGRLWAGGMESLRRRDPGGWQRIGGIEASNGPIISLAEASDGSLWSGGPSGVFVVDSHDRAVAVAAPPRPVADESNWNVVSDREGVVHAWSRSVVAARDGAQWRVIATAADLGGPVRGVALAREGGLWCVSGGVVRRLGGGDGLPVRPVPAQLGDDFASLLEDSSGNVWVGSFAFGLALLPADGTPAIVAELGSDVCSSSIAALLEDADGVVHVGTGGGGLAGLTPRRVGELHCGGAYSLDDSMRCFGDGPDGRVVVANSAGSIFELEGGQTRLLHEDQSRLGDAQIHGLHETADGTLWIGTKSVGLWTLREGSLVQRFGEAELGTDVDAFIERRDGLWFASSRGAWKWAGERLTSLPVGVDPSRPAVQDLVTDDSGVLWCATDSGIARQGERGFEPVAIEFLGERRADRRVRALRWLDAEFAMLSLSSGEPCIALAKLEGDVLRARLVVDHVRCSEFVVAHGDVWCNGDDVLRRFALDELRGWFGTNAAIAPPFPLRLTSADGLPSSQTAGPEGRRTRVGADGRLWFATHSGLAWVDPRRTQLLPRLPVVVLDECVIDGSAQRVERSPMRFVLPTGAQSVRLAFAVPTMRGAEGVQLAYRNAKESRWTPLGPERVLEFLQLPPGLHRFELRASNGDGRWSQALSRVELEMPPRWWQTLWFKLALSGAVLAFAALVYLLADRVAARRARERIEVAETLAAAHARSELLLAATDELVCFADPSGRLTALNEAGRAILGVEAMPARASTLTELIAPSVRPLFEHDALHELSEHGRWSGETLLAGAHGREVPVLASLLRHELPDGRVDFLSLVARNLSERVATEQARRELESQLRQSQKLEAIGTLAGGIAHDFNNLLTAILGHAELAEESLRRQPPPLDEVLDGLIEIRQASGRARDLVRQILRFSRRGEQQRELVVVDSVVREACRMVRSSFPADVELSVVVTAPGGTVMADPTEIHQVVVNLCTNAAQAMRSGKGRIEVSLAEIDVDEELARSVPRLRPGRWLRLAVEDDGVGMSAAVMEHVFEPFFTTKPQGEGTGLGLAMVHGIVGSHDGAIRVASVLGKGTRVEVWLPIVRAAVEVLQPLPDELPLGHLERVLLVDDEHAVLELGRRMLERLGYRVVACAHPAEAIAQVEATPGDFAVVVNDLSMPDLNGVQLARRLQELVPGLPMVLVTGYLTGIRRDDLRAQGIVELLYKPFDLRSLAHALDRALAPARLKSRASP